MRGGWEDTLCRNLYMDQNYLEGSKHDGVYQSDPPFP